VNAAQSAERPQRTRRRSWLDRPTLDWVVVGLIVFVVLWWTPLVRLFTATSQDGQRSAMSSTASALGTIAGFSIAALFFYSALDNPATQRVRVEWGGYLAGMFLRALAVMFLASMVCGFTAISVPNHVGAIVFLIAILAGFIKLARIILIVAALLHGQRHDAQHKPAALRTTRRPTA
jgi:hypothetical protein